MQIIINQTEIEEAIRAHFLTQMTVKPGHDIRIDFRATRGEAGATAVIDIVPAQAPAPAAPVVPVAHLAPVVAQIATLSATRPQTPAEVRQMMEAEAEAEAQAPAAETVAAPFDVPEASSATTTEAPSEETPAPSRTSIFKGLKRPVNA